MGKVKEWKEKYPDRVTEYQFPMGKVKLSANIDDLVTIVYQFPMGKVKGKKKTICPKKPPMYQFPMGKVKNNI